MQGKIEIEEKPFKQEELWNGCRELIIHLVRYLWTGEDSEEQNEWQDRAIQIRFSKKGAAIMQF